MELFFDCRWSDNLSEKFIQDFLFVLGDTWHSGGDKSRKSFERRYLNNIYGNSLLTIVYADGKPAATDAMWRNDIGGRKAYQTIDTCTLEQYRGKGLFRQITEKELSLLEKEVLVYGFPNDKSFPGYVKFGWQVLEKGKTHFCLTLRRCCKAFQGEIDFEYAKWYLAEKQDRVSYVKILNNYFLVIPTGRSLVAQIIGVASRETAMLFEPFNIRYPLLIYSDCPTKLNGENKGSIVVWNWQNDIIPLWKCDAV